MTKMDVNVPEDLEVIETQIQFNKDKLRELFKVNSIKYIDHMEIIPKEAFCFDIHLCLNIVCAIWLSNGFIRYQTF